MEYQEIHLNTDLLPLEISNSPWLYEDNFKINDKNNVGKWMLFFDKEIINDSWSFATKLYRENNLADVLSMKCSTNYNNPRASRTDNSIIILYCSDSSNEEKIINIGKNILKLFDYRDSPIIYYKTDIQTYEGTAATGCKKIIHIN